MPDQTPREALIGVLTESIDNAYGEWRGGSIGAHILAALEAAGTVVVPKEPTDEMKQGAAGYRIEEAATGWDATAADVWKDMNAFSPYRVPDV